MKKVAGTLKLDQAQFRELEAFSKFGSDLDAATQLTIDRGRRNQEVLKQAQYAPVPVEQQVALIFASTKGYLDKVPLNKVKEFEKEFLAVMTTQHKDVMEDLRGGKLDDHTLEVLNKEAGDMARKFTNQA
jgi:F-type H+-transporting ATPase subunit alpha